MADQSRNQVEYDHEMRVWQGNLTIATMHMQAVTGFGTLTINSAILTNGAAAVAVLALLGAVSEKDYFNLILPPACNSLGYFGAGTFAAMLAAACSYISQSFYMEEHVKSADSKQEVTSIWGKGFFAAAVLAVAVAICAFPMGLYAGLNALALIHPTK